MHLDSFSPKGAPALTDSTHDRIVRAVQLMADGVPMKQAADQVGWSYQVLKNRLKDEYHERAATNSLHLAAMYFREGSIK